MDRVAMLRMEWRAAIALVGACNCRRGRTNEMTNCSAGLDRFLDEERGKSWKCRREAPIAPEIVSDAQVANTILAARKTWSNALPTSSGGAKDP